ncbi:MAG: type II toxin-antitoxin system VapC family toxin [Roseitalea sp.]|jgi:PIN domain nuclease of toxin-antitoxin system|nr:type II toxin-antitoxin system VapC family toxin [Roseitalea sp.]MBO6723135.1 type II toxin-antitoxin system VapC family toxin [Roseitalea sp.]MBO6744659.1 type II toxin-antitoxin system VapC family toxin [Roseitalea sp.]
MTIVLDASAIVAHLNDEPGGEKVGSLLDGALVSTVNLCEVGTKLADKGVPDDDLDVIMNALRLSVVAFDQKQSRIAVALRTPTRSKGLSLADRACLALAQTMDATAVTADRAWADLDTGVTVEVIR